MTRLSGFGSKPTSLKVKSRLRPGSLNHPSPQPPHNRRDLPDNLCIHSVPQPSYPGRFAGTVVNDEVVPVERTTRTEIPAIPFEDQVEPRFGRHSSGEPRGLFDSPVDDGECRIDEPGMHRHFNPADPEHIREGEILEAGKVAQRVPEEQRNFLPLGQQRREEGVASLEAFVRACRGGTVTSIRCRTLDKFIGDRLAPALVKRYPGRAHEPPEI